MGTRNHDEFERNLRPAPGDGESSVGRAQLSALYIARLSAIGRLDTLDGVDRALRTLTALEHDHEHWNPEVDFASVASDAQHILLAAIRHRGAPGVVPDVDVPVDAEYIHDVAVVMLDHDRVVLASEWLRTVAETAEVIDADMARTLIGAGVQVLHRGAAAPWSSSSAVRTNLTALLDEMQKFPSWSEVSTTPSPLHESLRRRDRPVPPALLARAERVRAVRRGEPEPRRAPRVPTPESPGLEADIRTLLEHRLDHGLAVIADVPDDFRRRVRTRVGPDAGEPTYARTNEAIDTAGFLNVIGRAASTMTDPWARVVAIAAVADAYGVVHAAVPNAAITRSYAHALERVATAEQSASRTHTTSDLTPAARRTLRARSYAASSTARVLRIELEVGAMLHPPQPVFVDTEASRAHATAFVAGVASSIAEMRSGDRHPVAAQWDGADARLRSLAGTDLYDATMHAKVLEYLHGARVNEAARATDPAHAQRSTFRAIAARDNAAAMRLVAGRSLAPALSR